MKNFVTAMLLGAATAENLRNLATDKEGNWIPDACSEPDVECALQDDGYWFADKDGNWTHFQYAKREVNGREKAGYEVQDRTGNWKFIEFQKREGDGGYWIDDMNGQWKFRPYDKKHDQEGGLGYWIEKFNGEYTYVEYEKVKVEGGYNVTHLDGTVKFFKNPVVKIDDGPKDKFDAEAANKEQINEAAKRAEAELAGKIVGVAE